MKYLIFKDKTSNCRYMVNINCVAGVTSTPKEAPLKGFIGEFNFKGFDLPNGDYAIVTNDFRTYRALKLLGVTLKYRFI